MEGLKKKAVSRKEETFIPGKKVVKEPESKRVVLTEHKSLATKPIDPNTKPNTLISSDNLSYLTLKKSEQSSKASKAVKSSKEPKKFNLKKHEVDREEEEHYIGETEEYHTEQATEVKTVFKLAATEENHCTDLKDIVASR